MANRLERKATVSLLYEIRNSFGDLLLSLDFGRLPVGDVLKASFRLAFEGQFGHLTPATQKQSFSSLRKFSEYLQTVDCGVDALSEKALQGFTDALSKSDRKNATNQSVQNVVRSLLIYAVRQKYPGMPRSLDDNVVGFRREEVIPRTIISQDLRRKIWDLCQEEIEQIEKRVAAGTWAMRVAENEGISELGDVLRALLEIAPGYVKKEIVRKAVPGLVQRVTALGGFRYVYSHVFLTYRDLLPFYLAILVETGGNPEAIHKTPRDCFIKHPRQELVLFVWEKKRAHREQIKGSPVNKEWSVAGIAKKLLALNENLVPLARPADRSFLFLASNGASVRRSCTQLLHLYLEEFRDKHGLERFTFRQFRDALAEEAYLFGSVDAAQQKLNHRSAQTTKIYLNTPAIRAANEKIIVQFSGLIESSARSISTSPKRESHMPETGPFNTVFGFGCKDPLGGIAVGSQKGKVCEQFFGCGTCPGAIILLDDPTNIAKLLATVAHLKKERSRALREGWSLRFEKLWEPTLQVIERDLLPKVTPEILRLASERIVPALPRLE
ncbi:hypothetical protein [Hylemonella gracilis]|uniref:hypothetical protein n=1 Tax=Hylemonella gracilis TaxID=80880 RepID=UPI000302B1E6|nr:hypothetical protein [Hylemonella gracilis]